MNKLILSDEWKKSVLSKVFERKVTLGISSRGIGKGIPIVDEEFQAAIKNWKVINPVIVSPEFEIIERFLAT